MTTVINTPDSVYITTATVFVSIGISKEHHKHISWLHNVIQSFLSLAPGWLSVSYTVHQQLQVEVVYTYTHIHVFVHNVMVRVLLR